jgi:hypothetical protein
MADIFIFTSLNGLVLQEDSILYNHAGTRVVLELYTACESHLADPSFCVRKVSETRTWSDDWKAKRELTDTAKYEQVKGTDQQELYIDAVIL